MSRRFYRGKRYFQGGRFAGFQWQIERKDYTIQGVRDIRFKIRRKKKLEEPVYGDYMSIRVRMQLIDTLLPDKKSGRAMYDVYEVKVWKGGKRYGDVTHHKKKSAAFNRFNNIVVSLMRHLKNHDTAQAWRPPKRG